MTGVRLGSEGQLPAFVGDRTAGRTLSAPFGSLKYERDATKPRLMVVEYVRYKVDAVRAESFVQAYRKAAASLELSPYCKSYELTRCVEEPERFVLRLEWTSQTDHMDGFRKSEEFRSFFFAVQPYLKDIEEMHHYETTGVASGERVRS